MIDANNPDINVDEIMEKIRAEVAKRKAGSMSSPQPAPKSAYASQPLPSFSWSQVSSSLTMAEHFWEVGTTNSVMQKYPKVIRWIALLTGRIILHLTQPISFPQRKFNQSILQASQTLLNGVQALQQEISGRSDTIAALESRINELTKQKADHGEVMMLTAQKADRADVTALREQKADRTDVTALTQHKADRTDITALREQKADRADVAALGEQKADRTDVAALREQKADRADVAALGEQKADRTDVTALREQKADRTDVAALGEQKAGKEETERLRGELKEILRQIREHKLNLLDQERRLRLLLEEARKRLPEPISTEQIEKMLTEEDHLLNAMYVSFEDQFRGSRDDIKERQKVYLPYIQEANAGSKQAPILDVGCGRGEWLELCRNHNLLAKGVDINSVMVSQCREYELDVTQRDAIAFLQEQKPNSFGAITGFQIVEHLPLKLLITLFDETLRVLCPGGIVLFETPNPENLIVGGCNFYTDPTHLNPIPPHTLKFILEARGFVDIQHISEKKKQVAVQDVYVNTFMNDWINKSPDYAVIAKRA